MDPFSITVGVIGILQLVKSCLKLSQKHIGPSALSSVDTEMLLQSLYEFHGASRNLQTHMELVEDDDLRMSSLEYLKPAVQRSHEAAQLVKDYLQKSGIARTLRGAKFDKTLKIALKSLDDASKLFNMAILSDQQTIMLSVNKYVLKLNEDISDIRAVQLDAQQDNLYRDIRSWLGAQADNDMNSQQHEHNLSSRHSGSCDWLLGHGTFKNWLDANEQEFMPILWLKGSPGAGKSFLCSRAIDYVTQLQKVCLHYFFRFDYQPESGSGRDDSGTHAVRTASLLVDQVFRHFWKHDRGIAIPVGAYIETVQKNMKTLAEVLHLCVSVSNHSSQGQGPISIENPITLYLFLDGLDEYRSPQAVEEVLKLFEDVDDGGPVKVKLWVSSRDTNIMRHRLGQCHVINFDEHAESDVQNFLTYAVPKFNTGAEQHLEIAGRRVDDWVLQELQKRAKCNFLFAKLMIERLKDGAFSADDIRVLITSEVPSNFAEMYKRIFSRYHEDQHKYISLLFSLIAFARRPLYLYELREALTLAFSDPLKGLDPSKAPMSLQRLFAPLIEMQEEPDHPGNPLCRLCHGTVHEFLISNPNVLCIEAKNQASFLDSISPSRVGDLCLRYLSQRRYAVLLEPPWHSCHEPLSYGQESVQQHGLLPYCAKYWDRHLEDLTPTSDLRKTISLFLNSPNFQTLLQVQSLYVTGQFAQFTILHNDVELSRSMHRRVFPSWFNRSDTDRQESVDYQTYRKDYRHFFHEWAYLLERATCVSSEGQVCSNEHFRGEVDRCLSGLLGPTNFLNRMKEKYPSFMLTKSALSYRKSDDFVIADGLSLSKGQFVVISSSPLNNLNISIETWDLSHPTRPDVISTTSFPALGIDFPSNNTQTVSFSNDGGLFNLRNHIFNQKQPEKRILLEQQSSTQHSEPISIDFDMRDNIVVIASRNVYKHGKEAISLKQTQTSKTGIDSTESSDSELSQDEEEDGYSSSDDENSAEDTCSEGSTEVDSDSEEVSEDDLDGSDDFSDSSESIDSDSQESELGDTLVDKPRLAIGMNYQQLNNNLLDLGDDPVKPENGRPTYPGVPGRYRDPKDRINASISVYNYSSGKAVRMFHYKHDIPAMLYHSPPVLHPFKPLVFWPLGGGDVLFADYVEKTYFIRGSMPTTRDARHISMKAQFSPCGRYLHIASVEGQVARNSISNLSKKIALSVFINTHRLSEHKTTRSPPHCIYKIKIELGQFSGLSLAKLPITFTWTADHLYFSISGHRLNVFRVELFKPATGISPVAIPKLSVMLPLSASRRQVYYMPPKDDNSPGMVLIGSYGKNSKVQLKPHSARPTKLGMGDLDGKEPIPYPCPPMGFYINEQDFGGWGPGVDNVVADSVESGERFRNGKLVRKMEYFNWQDDIDLEGICDFCDGLIYYKSR